MEPGLTQMETSIVRPFLGLTNLVIVAISLVMVLVTLAQVIFRDLIEAPLPWSEELALMC